MGYASVSFDPDSVASNSDAASSALAAAAAASDAASSAGVAAAKGSAASSKIADKSATWDKASAASSAVIVAAGKASDASSAVAARSAIWDKASAASSQAALKANTTYDTPAASSIAGFRASFQASEALVFPQLCYINANGFAALANADSAATASGMLVMAPGSVANAASFAAIMPGTMVGHSAWSWTLGAPIFMGSSAGSMTQTKPSAASAIVRIVGHAGRNSNVMWFNPDGIWMEM